MKWEASTIWVFISSAGRSRTVSQKGTRSWLECLTQVSMIDQISLHRTSVATWGYLPPIRQTLRGTVGQGWGKWTQLETAVLLSVYLASHVTHQAVKDIYALEVVDEPSVLGLALLQQVVLVEYGLEGYVILVQQTVD